MLSTHSSLGDHLHCIPYDTCDCNITESITEDWLLLHWLLQANQG